MDLNPDRPIQEIIRPVPRITKVITRTGDKGNTGLADGSSVKKTSCRIHALGEVDELNSVLGVVVSLLTDEESGRLMMEIQNTLFDLGGELSQPGASIIQDDEIRQLEDLAVQINKRLPVLEEFILPGGNHAAAMCHLARAVCRRCERRLLQLSDHEPVNRHSLVYLNRLSDLLFVLARTINHGSGDREISWVKKS